MRLFKVTRDTGFADLSRELFRARLSAGQADRARESLESLNPHVNLKKVRPGDVLLVPDTPSFKISGTDPVHAEILELFEELVRRGLSDASERLRAGNAARAEQRVDVAAALKSAALRRAVADDQELSNQLTLVMKNLKQQEQEDGERVGELAETGKAALGALAAIGKLFG